MATKRFKSVMLAMKSIDSQIRSAAKQAARECVLEALAFLNDSVSDWSNPPTFKIKETNRTGKTTFSIVTVGTDEEVMVFNFVDKGTKPHIIRAKDAPFLVFNAGYQAKTSPVANARKIKTGGQSEGSKVVTKEVKHPGTEPRSFVEYAALLAEESYEKRFAALMKAV